MIKAAEFISGARKRQKLYESAMKDVKEKYQLSQVEVDILAFLHNNPGLDTAVDIVKYRMIPKANVSKAVESLNTRGLLAAVRDRADRRKVHLKAEPEAKEMVEEIIQAQSTFFGWLFEGFSEEELKSLDEIGKRIMRNMDKKIGENGKDE